MREHSPEAKEWLTNYHGSIDATALLLAFDAGRASERKLERRKRQLMVTTLTRPLTEAERAELEGSAQ